MAGVVGYGLVCWLIAAYICVYGWFWSHVTFWLGIRCFLLCFVCEFGGEGKRML